MIKDPRDAGNTGSTVRALTSHHFGGSGSITIHAYKRGMLLVIVPAQTALNIRAFTFASLL